MLYSLSQLVLADGLPAAQTLTARADTLAPIFQSRLDGIEAKYGAPWYLSHRVDLHSTLRHLATERGGDGRPVKIRLRAKVTSIVRTSSFSPDRTI